MQHPDLCLASKHWHVAQPPVGSTASCGRSCGSNKARHSKVHAQSIMIKQPISQLMPQQVLCTRRACCNTQGRAHSVAPPGVSIAQLHCHHCDLKSSCCMDACVQALETVSVLGCSMAVAIAFPTQVRECTLVAKSPYADTGHIKHTKQIRHQA